MRIFKDALPSVKKVLINLIKEDEPPQYVKNKKLTNLEIAYNQLDNAVGQNAIDRACHKIEAARMEQEIKIKMEKERRRK